MSNASLPIAQLAMLVPTQPPTEFPLFSHLAPELRLKIWSHACFPRTVSVRYLPSLDICVSSSPIPPILQVSREAREEALKTFSLAFGTPSSPARTYFNPYRDTLYLPRHMPMGYDETLRDFRTFIKDEEGVLDETAKLAIDHVDSEVKRPWESYNKACLIRGFKKLDQVVLVLCQCGRTWQSHWGKKVSFVEPSEKSEEVLRFGVDFRQGFWLEETGLEDVCRELGREYEKHVLPNVRFRDMVAL